ncbi:hypothetical protein CPB83DRAFT_850030 [Crepidotus variabilis]|uniref:Uncharacterized protein n=1 Tax=Crepidotus variabilis TaxID=179855 RepID=A0A9P6JRN6_9AGAR|nr:hypothetical protein CPB83DRAFT_850030 [Crepidotus variabilis]
MTANLGRRPFPQEIVDLFVDELAGAFNLDSAYERVERRKALNNLNSTSKSFRSRARLHLFSDISIALSPDPWTNHNSLALQILLSQNPDIAQTVVTLRLVLRHDYSQAAGPAKFDDNTLPCIVDKLQNLRQLSITSTGGILNSWGTFGTNLLQVVYALHNRPTLETLILYQVSFIDVVLFKWSSLKKVVLHGSPIIPQSEQALPSFLQHKSNVQPESIALSTPWQDQPFITADDWTPIRNVKHVKMRICDDWDMTFARKIIHRTERQLESLSLLVQAAWIPNSRKFNGTTNPFSFQYLQSIDYEEIGLRFDKESADITINSILAFCACPALQIIGIKIRWFASQGKNSSELSDSTLSFEAMCLGKEIWSKLDDALSRLPALRDLQIEIDLLYPSESESRRRIAFLEQARLQWVPSMAFPHLSSKNGRRCILLTCKDIT